MSLAKKRPDSYAFRSGALSLQRFSWLKGDFVYHFTVRLSYNTQVENCEENTILLANVSTKEALQKARILFDNVLGRLGFDLNTYKGWRQSAITRFSLCTPSKGAKPELLVDDDPATIPWPSVHTLRQHQSYTCTLPIVPEPQLKRIRWLGAFRYVSLVCIGEQHFVYKSVEQPETMKVWEKEFTNLTKFVSSPFIVDIVGIVTARYPYCPNGEDVVKGFLLEYGEGGSLKEVLAEMHSLQSHRVTKWALQIAKGIQVLHQHNVVHGDLKPENIIITSSDDAKIIDLAQSGFTPTYHAPEMPTIVGDESPWPPSLDVYSFGVLYWILLGGDRENLPHLASTPLSSAATLVARCVANDPFERPSIGTVVYSLEQLNK